MSDKIIEKTVNILEMDSGSIVEQIGKIKLLRSYTDLLTHNAGLFEKSLNSFIDLGDIKNAGSLQLYNEIIKGLKSFIKRSSTEIINHSVDVFLLPNIVIQKSMDMSFYLTCISFTIDGISFDFHFHLILAEPVMREREGIAKVRVTILINGHLVTCSNIEHDIEIQEIDTGAFEIMSGLMGLTVIANLYWSSLLKIEKGLR